MSSESSESSTASSASASGDLQADTLSITKPKPKAKKIDHVEAYAHLYQQWGELTGAPTAPARSGVLAQLVDPVEDIVSTALSRSVTPGGAYKTSATADLPRDGQIVSGWRPDASRFKGPNDLDVTNTRLPTSEHREAHRTRSERRVLSGSRHFDLVSSAITPQAEADLEFLQMRGTLNFMKSSSAKSNSALKTAAKLREKGKEAAEFVQIGRILDPKSQKRVKNRRTDSIAAASLLADSRVSADLSRRYAALEDTRSKGNQAYYVKKVAKRKKY